MKNNEPAFPVSKDHDLVPYKDGLSKKEYATITFMSALITGFASRGQSALPTVEWLADKAKSYAEWITIELNKDK